MLHSRLLRYLDAVASAGSIRKAAEELNIAASAINRRILALEAELGTPVFERLHKRMRLTSAGEMVVSHVRQTLREHERMQTRIEDLKADTFGSKGYAIGLKDDSVKLLKTAAIPEATWTEVMKLRDDVIAGTIKVEPIYDAAKVRALMTSVSE